MEVENVRAEGEIGDVVDSAGVRGVMPLARSEERVEFRREASAAEEREDLRELRGVPMGEGEWEASPSSNAFVW